MYCVAGKLLFDKDVEGQLHVKKVWVADYKEEDLATGVDFRDLTIDRYRALTFIIAFTGIGG